MDQLRQKILQHLFLLEILVKQNYHLNNYKKHVLKDKWRNSLAKVLHL